MLSILYGLISAIGWGAADFTGGLASRRTKPYRVLFLAEFAGLIPLIGLAWVSSEPIPALPAPGTASPTRPAGPLATYAIAAKTVREAEARSHGEVVPVHARVLQIDMLSSHADREDILTWLSTASKQPRITFLIHGE